MITWDRPSGTQLETNDLPETIAYCESLGWKKASDETKSIDKMKKDELIAYAQDEHEVELDAKLSKADLLEAVKKLDAVEDTGEGNANGS